MASIARFGVAMLLALGIFSCSNKETDTYVPTFLFKKVSLPADYSFLKMIEPSNGDLIWLNFSNKVRVLRNNQAFHVSSVDTSKTYVDIGLVNDNTVYFLEEMDTKSVLYLYNWDTQVLVSQEDLPKCNMVFYDSKDRRFLLRNKTNVLGATADLFVPDGIGGYKSHKVPQSGGVSLLLPRYISKIVEGVQDTIWVLTTAKNGAWGFANDTFVQLQPPNPYALSDICMAPGNVKWAFPGALWKNEAGRWTSIDLVAGSPSRSFIRMERLSDGTIWVVFDSEIVEFKGPNKQTRYHSLMEKEAGQEIFYGALAWYRQRNGRQWIQTGTKGVFRADDF
jgi:hypothetical protein